MRPVLVLIAAPIIAITAMTTVLLFPKPTDLVAAFTPVEREVNVVQGGATNVQTAVLNMSEALPVRAAEVTERNSDCFEDLAFAGEAKLDRCAEVVYQALIEVEKVRGKGIVREALDPNQERAVERLRYAALETCRAQWTNQPIDASLEDEPACKAANIEIASSRE